jgi:hypothetical protein
MSYVSYHTVVRCVICQTDPGIVLDGDVLGLDHAEMMRLAHHHAMTFGHDVQVITRIVVPAALVAAKEATT